MAHTAAGVNLAVANLFGFRNDVVLVTGGATGLGEMAVQAFVQNGARVLIASRKQSELERTAARLNDLGPGRCEYIVADLKDKAGCGCTGAINELFSISVVLLHNDRVASMSDVTSYDRIAQLYKKMFHSGSDSATRT